MVRLVSLQLASCKPPAFLPKEDARTLSALLHSGHGRGTVHRPARAATPPLQLHPSVSSMLCEYSLYCNRVLMVTECSDDPSRLMLRLRGRDRAFAGFGPCP